VIAKVIQLQQLVNANGRDASFYDPALPGYGLRLHTLQVCGCVGCKSKHLLYINIMVGFSCIPPFRIRLKAALAAGR
jgi:hypothetical protein